jgi:hypothetical protein
MAINFPTGSTIGDYYTFNGLTWQWNGSYWQVYPTASGTGNYVNKSGDTMTGNLTLPNLFATGITATTISATTYQNFPNVVTESQKTGLTPTIGYMVYQTDGSDGVYVYKSSGWVQMI